MRGVVLVCLVLGSGGSPDDEAAYREAAAGAGRDADAQVKLALWCEARGLDAERTRHLAMALIADPAHAVARGLLGLVQDEGKWRRPEELADRVQADPERAALLAEYHAKRARTPATAEAQWKLAVWCEAKGLKPEAAAHLAAVVALDPGREEAWRRLGYRKHQGTWRTEAQIAAMKAEADARRKADAAWRPRLEKLRKQLGSESRRADAEAELARVSDPRAVPAILSVFGRSHHIQAAQLLGQVDSPAAARALAFLAVFSPDQAARRVATETLRKYDPSDVVGRLIALVRKPIRYEVKPVGGPGSPGVLFVEGERFNQQFVYSAPPPPDYGRLPGDFIEYDQFGLPTIVRYAGVVPSRSQIADFIPQAQADAQAYADARDRLARVFGANGVGAAGDQLVRAAIGPAPTENLDALRAAQNRGMRFVTSDYPVTIRIPVGRMMLESQKAAAASQEQLKAQVAALEGANAAIHQGNDPVLFVLDELTGQEFGEDPNAWRKWWADQQGYAFQRAEYDRPTVIQEVPPAYIPQPVAIERVFGPATNMRFPTSCFAAGTPVHTLQGPKPIETLEIGDRVLTQDPETGSLSFEPILRVRHNRPAPTLRIRLEDGQEIVSTGIHRLWKAGRGWVMARDLKAGDVLRTLGGVSRVSAIEPERTVPVFNLLVRGPGNYFVGERGILAHDDRSVEPVERPFDATPELAAVAGAAAR